MSLYTGVEKKFDLGFWPVPTIFFTVYLLFWAWECGYGLYLMLKGLKTATGKRHEQIKYFAFAGVIAFLGGATNWPMWYGIYFPPYANILISVYFVIMAYAITKYRLLNVTVFVERMVVFVAVYIFILGIPLTIGYKYHLWMYSTYIAIFLASIGPIIISSLQRKAENIILADQKRYHHLLLDAANGILFEHDLDKLPKLIVDVIKKSIDLNFVGIYLKNRDKFVAAVPT
jgi:hypothetical protein